MELIVSVNLAFSIVGFFFIVRMWREVKTRRDEFGENFNIPRGREVAQPVQYESYRSPGVSMEQVAAMVAAMQPQQKAAPEQTTSISEGDLQKLIQGVMVAQNGGVDELHS